MYKPYEFKAQDAYDFARYIGGQSWDKGEELKFKICPYCKPSDTNKQNTGTFSINLKTGQFKCLRASCGMHGNMITLSKDFDFSLGNEVDEYYRSRRQFRKLKQLKEPVVPKPEALEYLKQRGIPEWVAAKYEITVQNEHPNVLVFPFYDENGQLQFVKYRKTDFDKTKDKNKEWCEVNTKPILFGMKQCDESDSRLIITEGQLDTLSVVVAGYKNVVSVPTGAKGFTWIPYCWDWICKYSEVIVFGDYEKGSISLLDDLKKRLPCRMKHIRIEDYNGYKDANDILRNCGIEQIKKCVDNAIDVPIHRVLSLADVEDVDIFKIPKLKTGLRDVDRLLYGGLPFGYVHIIAGKRGDGKSTFGSQLIAQAREQGHKTFVYSGELTNSNYKAWMDYQVAGKENIIEVRSSRTGVPYWKIAKSNMEQINQWYLNHCYIYDNTMVYGDEQENLIKTIEEVICRYGVDVILVDNLMTALDIDEDVRSDKYDRQSQFVKKLTKIALKHNVLILLVAHRRKNNFSTDANDEISGSADITNLAGIVMSYDRDKELDNPSDRKLVIAKNRLFGKLNLNGFCLHFEEMSKRIYGDLDDVNYQYGWQEKLNVSDGFMPVGEQEELPFSMN